MDTAESRRIQHGTGAGTGYPERGRSVSDSEEVVSLQHLDSNSQINLTLSLYSASAQLGQPLC